MARASSGSRSSIKSIEPLMSANSAVTVLRSPSVSVEASASSAVTRIASAGVLARTIEAFPASAAPQSPQNFLAAGFSEPHLGQRLPSCAPQSAQNRLPAGFSAPHFEQRISASLPLELYGRTDARSCSPIRKSQSPKTAKSAPIVAPRYP